MSVLVLDAGNLIIKGKIAKREQGEIAFPHALQQLTESEYQKILVRARTNGSAKDYIRVNGTPYVIGGSAEGHGLVSKRSGAARYTRDYYGVLTAIVLAQVYGLGRELAVFCSYAPGDVKYREV